MPKYTQQNFPEKWQLWKAIKRGEEVKLVSTDLDPGIPRNGWVAIEGPRFSHPARWQAVVKLEDWRVVEMRDDGKQSQRRPVRVTKGKAAPAADLAWGWPGLHEQKMHVASDGHASELGRQTKAMETKMAEKVGREGYVAHSHGMETGLEVDGE